MRGKRSIYSGRRVHPIGVLASICLLTVSVLATPRQALNHDEGISITAMPDPVSSGGQLVVRMTVQNFGPQPAAAANLTTATPTGTTFVSASTSKGAVIQRPATGGTGSIQCQFGPLTVGEVEFLTVVLTVTAQPGSTINIVGQVQPANPSNDPNQSNNMANITVIVVPPVTADLAVSIVPEGDEAGTESLFSYTITVQNNSSDSGAARRDSAPNVMLFAPVPETAGFASVTASQGTTSAPMIGQPGTVICQLGTLDNGASATVDVTVTVLAEAGGTLSFFASSSSDAIDPFPDDNVANVATPIVESNQAMLMWEAPDPPTAEIPLPPPRRFVVTQAAGRVSGPVGFRLDPDAGRRGDLIGYNVYRSNKPGVTPSAGNLYTSTPPNQTSVTSPVAPGGSFFTVTAVYDDGESAPANEASADVAAATLTSVKVKPSKIVAKGTGFSTGVVVFIDGIPFLSAAALKANGGKVVQKGALLTGQTIQQYLQMHPQVVISFRNSNGGIATYLHPR